MYVYQPVLISGETHLSNAPRAIRSLIEECRMREVCRKEDQCHGKRTCHIKRLVVNQTIHDHAGRPSHNKESETHKSGVCYPPETLKALQDMNDKFACVLLGDKFRIFREMFHPPNTRLQHSIEFITFSGFHLFHLPHKYLAPTNKGYMKKRPISKIWIEWPGRRTYDAIIFDSAEKSPRNIFMVCRKDPVLHRHLRKMVGER